MDTVARSIDLDTVYNFSKNTTTGLITMIRGLLFITIVYVSQPLLTMIHLFFVLFCFLGDIRDLNGEMAENIL
jgi:hypothetical protein